MPNRSPHRPVVLAVLDGWGVRAETADNAIALARAPTFDRLMASCPHAELVTWGTDVGLPEGQMGNSEVGHMNLGAGRVVNQELQRIGAAVADGSLARSPAVERLIGTLCASGGTCHVMGLVSPGGVHSHQGHIAALCRILDAAGVKVALHAFLDGRDSPPSSALGHIKDFIADTRDCAGLRIATVSGRYYAMDRDTRWERTALAYAALVDAQAPNAITAPDAIAAIEASYAAGVTDEFMKPVAIGDYPGMRDGDAILVANFRADRMRQILQALVDPAFDAFARPRSPRFAAAVGLVEYSERLNGLMDVIFPSERITLTLGEIVSRAGLTQLRIAETEKYPHVTFFFNGGEEALLPGEERILVPSPRVATYDLKPEMSAREVTDRLVAAIGSGRFEFIVVNYANADMVGHTGVLAAAITAIETVDACLDRLDGAVRAAGGVLLITADHGNAECMRDAATGEAHTQHTVGKVPVILSGAPPELGLCDGRLADVAPTLLRLMALPQPAAMTGRSLLVSRADEHAAGARRSA